MMVLTEEMFTMMLAGAYLAIIFLGVTLAWCLVAGIINKSIGG